MNGTNEYTHSTINIDEVAYLVCLGFVPYSAKRATFTKQRGVTIPTAMFFLKGKEDTEKVLAWRDNHDARSMVFPADFIKYRQDAKRIIALLLKSKHETINLVGE
jgi:hypothetical protein